MKHIRHQSNEDIVTRSLRGNGREFVEPVEDHRRSDEPPEDHCRDEESPGNPLPADPRR